MIWAKDDLMTTETDTKPKMRRSMRFLLIGSLTLNFLVAGVVVGGAVAHWHGGDERHRDFGFSSPYTRALDRDDRRSIGKAIRQHHKGKGAGRPNTGAYYREAVALLRQSPLDVEALTALLERQKSVTSGRQNAAQQIWLDHLLRMSHAERSAYADRLEAELNKRPQRGGPNNPNKMR